jgi:NADPH:quinone reductase-like Zn-dependent oxidoreductase
VICTADESIEERVRAITAGQGVRCAVDAVGGATGSAVVSALARNGRLLVYGTLSGEPLTLPPRTLMVNHRRVEGFWLSNWAKEQGVLTMLRLFRQITQLLRDGTFATEIGARFRLDEVRAAVEYAEKPGRTGKVLFQLGERMA